MQRYSGSKRKEIKEIFGSVFNERTAYLLIKTHSDFMIYKSLKYKAVQNVWQDFIFFAGKIILWGASAVKQISIDL